MTRVTAASVVAAPVAAALSWSLRAPGAGRVTELRGQHPAIATIRAVQAALASYAFPSPVAVRYGRWLGHDDTGRLTFDGADHGEARVHVEFAGSTGHRIFFEVPVMVHHGHVYAPSVMLTRVGMRVLSQESIDELAKEPRLERVQPTGQRMFDGPVDGKPMKIVPMLDPRPNGVFSVTAQHARRVVRAADRTVLLVRRAAHASRPGAWELPDARVAQQFESGVVPVAAKHARAPELSWMHSEWRWAPESDTRVAQLLREAAEYSESLMPGALVYALLSFQPHYHHGAVTIRQNDVFEVEGAQMPRPGDGFEDPYPRSEHPRDNIRIRARRVAPTRSSGLVYLTESELEYQFAAVPRTPAEPDPGLTEMPGEAIPPGETSTRVRVEAPAPAPTLAPVSVLAPPTPTVPAAPVALSPPPSGATSQRSPATRRERTLR